MMEIILLLKMALMKMVVAVATIMRIVIGVHIVKNGGVICCGGGVAIITV